jgi:rubrerythrin
VDAAKRKDLYVICRACGAIFYPQVWQSHGGCPSCHHPHGDEKQLAPDAPELNK